MQKLLDKEKDFLRKHFSTMSESVVSTYKGCLRSVPIYRAERGTTEGSSQFIPITSKQGSEAFLPIGSTTSDLPVYPDNILHPASATEE